MTRIHGTPRLALAIVALAGIALTASQQATPARAVPQPDVIMAVTGSNSVLVFFSQSPEDIIREFQVTGLRSGEALMGIDVRPNGGQLYGLGSTSRLYTIDVSTGAATQVGPRFSTLLDGNQFGFDVNPVADLIRVTSDKGQNLRIHPDTAAVTVDTALAYDGADAQAGRTPRVHASAYTNPDVNPNTGTTLYDFDVPIGLLVSQNPPNDGTLNTVGFVAGGAQSSAQFFTVPQIQAYLAPRTAPAVGFDISLSGTSYATTNTAVRFDEGLDGRFCGAGASLYAINISTGEAFCVGRIGTPYLIVRAIAVFNE